MPVVGLRRLTSLPASAVDPDRVLRFGDGTVVFDPVAWVYRTLSPEATELLEMLRERIEDGHTSRDALLNQLAAIVVEPDDDGPVDLSDSARADLLDWIDLARHLYA